MLLHAHHITYLLLPISVAVNSQFFCS